MRRYSASEARKSLAGLLDAAEHGEDVVIERRGVRFALKARSTRRKGRRRSVVAWVDPAVDAGNWTWELGVRGLRFAARGRRS
jgi:antitoxin (DNA-binding transcriptional repressor) of toxin-antitoxin stability system